MASSQDRVAKLLLRIEQRQQDVERAKQTLGSFERNFKSFKTEAERTNVALEKQAGMLLRQKIAAAQAEQATSKLTKAEDTLQKEVDQTNRAMERRRAVTAPQANQTQFISHDPRFRPANAGGNRAQQLGRELRLQLPAVPIGGGLSSEQGARVIEVFGRVSEGFSNMTGKARLLSVSLGLAAAGVAAFLAAASAINEQFARQTRALIQGQEEVQRLRLTGSRTEIEAAITARRAEIELAEARIEENRRVLDQFRADAGPTVSALSDIFNIAGIQELRVETQRLEQQSETASLAEGRLAALRNDTAVATRLAAEAEQAIRDEVTRLRIGAANAQIEAERFAITATHEQFKARRLFLEQEINILERAQGRLQELGEFIPPELVARLENARQQLIELTPELERYVYNQDLARRALEFVNNIIPNTNKEIDEFTAKQSELQDAMRRVTELQEQFNLRLVDIERRRQQAIEDAGFTRNQDIARARRDSATAEAEAVRKSGLRRVEIERDTQRNIARILRRSRFDIENAIQDRDAVALDLARRRRNEEVRDEKDNRRERLRELDNGLKEELRTIRRRLNQQILTIDERYAEQVRRADLAAQRSIAVETEKFQRELRIRGDAVKKLLGQDVQAETQRVKLNAQGNQARLQQDANYFKATQQLAQQTFNSIFKSQAARVQQFSRPSPTPRGGGFMPSMDTGGRILSDGLVFAHAGEMIVNPRRGQTSGVNINVEGLNRREIHRVLDKALDDYTLENF